VAQRTAKQRRADNARQAKLAQLAAAERRRKARLMGGLGAVGAVILIVAIMVVVKVATNGNGNQGNAAGNASSASVVGKVTSVPASVFNRVGAGTANNGPGSIKGGGTPLSAHGKPEILYVGAEYCPFCAAERWPVVAALSRFGTWSGVGLTSSASNDYAPDTPTLTFHGASYSSPYISFAGFETTDRNHQPLDNLPASLSSIFNKFDSPPYVDQSAAGTIPFVYYAGKYMSNGASLDPLALHGMTHAQVAKAMHDPNSAVAKAVDGSANTITATICKLTGGKPGNVCSSPGVQAAAKKLK
jgi:hypothetical protein